MDSYASEQKLIFLHFSEIYKIHKLLHRSEFKNQLNFVRMLQT
jgi:hypothetical protein